MNITTRTSLVGCLLALAALQSPPGKATAAQSISSMPEASPAQPLESRLARLSAVLQERTAQTDLPDLSEEQLLAIGWTNGHNRGWVNGRQGRGWTDGRGNRGWVDTGRVGWSDGRGRNWVNVSPWRNGWGDSGGFFNFR